MGDGSKACASPADPAVEVERIVSEFESDLLRYATRLVNSPSGAQDVVQNVFIKLFTRWNGQAEDAGRLKAWLYRVTHNEAVDYVRREARLSLLHDRHAEELRVVEDDRSEAGPHDADERKTLVLNALKKLHPREQQIVLLRLEHGLSYQAIADVTGRTEGNVGNILHHAIKKLSRKLTGVIA
jgi:RNA polymerase sigma factor (sigma-70 family)